MTAGITTGGTRITRPFAGRDRPFQLRLGEISELERIQGAGVGAITERILQGGFYARDIWETLRLGLEGGGLSEIEATALMMRYHAEPLIPYLGLASDILAAALAGVPAPNNREAPGKRRAGRTGRPATSPHSMPPAAPSD